MKVHYIAIGLGVALIAIAQIIFVSNEGMQWIPRIIVTIIGVVIASIAWEALRRDKRSKH